MEHVALPVTVLLLLAGWAWPAWVAAVRLAGSGAPPRARLCLTVVIAWAGIYLAFRVLGALSIFRPWAMAIVLVVLAAVTLLPGVRQGPAARLRADAAAAVAAVRDAGGLLRALLLAAALLVGLRLVRGLASPPLAYDALTYHLARAAAWVRGGDLSPFLAPDAWRYCARYPDAGDALWAVALLPGGDALVAVASVAAILALAAGTYAAARELSGTVRASMAAALCVVTLPPAIQAATAAYVDVPALALIMLGLSLAARHERGKTPVEAAAAVLAFAMAAATRAGGLPWLGLGVVAVAASALRTDGRTFRATAIACAAAALPAIPTYLDTLAATGSPIYPLGLTFMGVELFSPSPEFALVHSGAAVGREPSAAVVLPALFVPASLPHLNLGPLVPALFVVGVVGAVRAWRAGHRVAVSLAFLGAGASVHALLSGQLDAFLVVPWWLDKVGRFLLPAAAPLVVLGASVPGRVAEGVRAIGIATGLVLGVPLGISNAELPYVAMAAACVLPAGGLVAFRPTRRLWPFALAAGLAALPSVRAAARYVVYESAAAGDAFDLHPANLRSLSAWPLWRALDGPEGERVALTAGFDGVGHNWFTYPLFGGRIQNDVFHVPATRDGEVPDYAFPEATAPRLDRDAWLERLLASRAGVLVALDPPPPEVAWALAMPRVFVPLDAGPWGRAWRIDRQALVLAIVP